MLSVTNALDTEACRPYSLNNTVSLRSNPHHYCGVARILKYCSLELRKILSIFFNNDLIIYRVMCPFYDGWNFTSTCLVPHCGRYS